MHHLQRLLPRHFEILDLALAGASAKEIAGQVGMTPQSISNIINSPVFQDEMARRRKDIDEEINADVIDSVAKAREKLNEGSLSAVNTHLRLLESDDERVSQKSASEILKFAFEGKDTSGTGGITLNAEHVNLLVTTLGEIQKPGDKVVELQATDK